MLSIISASAAPRAVERFYSALRDRDVPSLLDALADDVVVTASDGMPLGVGGRHAGAWNAVVGLWARVHSAYDVTPVPDSCWCAADGTVVVHGWYEGTARRAARRFRAEFVHLMRVEDGVLAELRQITDTASWGAP